MPLTFDKYEFPTQQPTPSPDLAAIESLLRDGWEFSFVASTNAFYAGQYCRDIGHRYVTGDTLLAALQAALEAKGASHE